MVKAELNNYTFHYLENGDGVPVVFVHGSASDYRVWNNQIESFAQYYKVYVYSRRYHFPNERIADDADYSMPEQAEDLEAFLKLVCKKPAHLIGQSYGAFLCLLLAIKNPSLIRTLTLAEPPLITLFVSAKPEPSELFKLMLSRPRTALALIKLGATGIEPATKEAEKNNLKKAMEIFGKAVLGSDAYNNLSAERLEQVNANTFKTEFLGSGFSPLNEKDIQNITLPTLLIQGEKSPKIFHRIQDRLEELMPHTERKVISGSSHNMHESGALRFNEIVLSFLDKHKIL